MSAPSAEGGTASARVAVLALPGFAAALADRRPVLVADAEGRVLAANAAALSFAGLRAGEAAVGRAVPPVASVATFVRRFAASGAERAFELHRWFAGVKPAVAGIELVRVDDRAARAAGAAALVTVLQGFTLTAPPAGDAVLAALDDEDVAGLVDADGTILAESGREIARGALGPVVAALLAGAEHVPLDTLGGARIARLLAPAGEGAARLVLIEDAPKPAPLAAFPLAATDRTETGSAEPAARRWTAPVRARPVPPPPILPEPAVPGRETSAAPALAEAAAREDASALHVPPVDAPPGAGPSVVAAPLASVPSPPPISIDAGLARGLEDDYSDASLFAFAPVREDEWSDVAAPAPAALRHAEPATIDGPAAAELGDDVGLEPDRTALDIADLGRLPLSAADVDFGDEPTEDEVEVETFAVDRQGFAMLADLVDDASAEPQVDDDGAGDEPEAWYDEAFETAEADEPTEGPAAEADEPMEDAAAEADETTEDAAAEADEPMEGAAAEADDMPAALVPAETEHPGPAVAAPAFRFARRDTPHRFVWQMDAAGRFTQVSPELADALGPAAEGLVGRSFAEVAAPLGLDPEGRVAAALDKRDTWSGLTVLWPVGGAGLKVPVDLAALPAFGRDRAFDGYRGFGVVRTADAIAAPEPVVFEPAAGEDRVAETDFAPVSALVSDAEPSDDLLDVEVSDADLGGAVDDVTGEFESRALGFEIADAAEPDETSSLVAERESAPDADRDDAPRAEAPEVVAEPDAMDAYTTALARLHGEDPNEWADLEALRQDARREAETEIGRAPVVDRAAATDVEPPAEPAPPPSNVAALPPKADARIVTLPTAHRRPAETPPGRLSNPERAAFHEIAKMLGARVEGQEGEADAKAPPADAPRTDAPRTDTPRAEAPRLVVLPPKAEPSRDLIDLAAAEPRREPPAPVADLVRAGVGLVDELPIAVAILKESRIAHANRAFFELTGYDDLADLDAHDGLDALFAGPHALKAWAGDPAVKPVPVLAKDGRVLPVEARLTAVPWNGSSALMLSLKEVAATPAPAVAAPLAAPTVAEAEPEVDVTEFAARVAELEAILDTATDGVLILDADGRVLSVNRAGEALFDAALAEMRGKPMTAFLAPESHKSLLDYMDGLARNGVASVLNDGREVIGRVTGGGLVPLFMTMGRLGGGEARKFCAVLRDITQWKKAEEDLTAAKRHAEVASVHKSDFLAKISHEIRTPLNAIMGFAEVMMEERFGPIGNERYKDYLKDIRTSGSHIMSLVNDLLDLSKIEAGKMELKFEAVRVNDLLRDCVALMQPQANRERIIIRASLAQNLPAVVADPRSIRQIVLNLLSNAVKFTPAGGQVIVSTALEEGGELALRVRDTGIGMTEQEVATALEPFRQVHTTRTAAGGTGLGLPLTKALVEANRATFTIRSAKNQGTLVEIVFPPTRVLTA